MKHSSANGTVYGGMDRAWAYRNPSTLRAQITPEDNKINGLVKVYTEYNIMIARLTLQF